MRSQHVLMTQNRLPIGPEYANSFTFFNKQQLITIN